MISEIQHLSSRCGGGKSYKSIQYLYELLEVAYPTQPTVVFASKTNDLNQQNHDVLLDILKSVDQFSTYRIESTRIDSSKYKGRVTQKVSEALQAGFQGVIFTSHAVLNHVDPKLLSNVVMFIDEIPQSLIKTLSITYEAEDSGDTWETNILTQPSRYPGYEVVSLQPNADHKALWRVIHNIRTDRDNTRTKEVADLLEFLLEDYDTMYVTTYKQRRSYRCYQAINWQRLKLISEQVDSLTILSAQLKDSLFGFIARHCIKLNIIDGWFDPSVTLESKHRNKTKIIPFIKEGKWSSSLKYRSAHETLMLDGTPVEKEQSVVEYAQSIAMILMDNRQFIMAYNRKDTLAPLLENFFNVSKIKVITTAVHGINGLDDFDHAVYLASNRPNPFELKHLKMFALDHGATAQEIEQAIMIERCYENAYQCIARTSIRLSDPDLEKEHVFVVPDMHYANYLLRWFGKDTAYIDDTFSYTLKEDDSKLIKKKIVISILTRYQQGDGNIKDFIEQSPISEATFKRYKKKHHAELKEMGLLQTKSKK